jgi:predicted alpha/beta hydrolase family esterase
VTKQVLFIQGGGKGVHDEWDNQLVESLSRSLGSGYDVGYPRMPDEDHPRYKAWKSALKSEYAALEDGAILVGHSIGGTILLNALAEEPPKRHFSGIFLIAAPFIGDGGWPSDDIKARMHLGGALPDSVPLYLYHGDADKTAPVTHIDLYAASIPDAVVRRLKGRDHQLNNDLSEVAADIKHLAAKPA